MNSGPLFAASSGAASEFLPGLLRGLGIPADLRQRESIRTALELLGSEAPPATRAAVIAAVLARSPRQQERLQVELAAWLTPLSSIQSELQKTVPEPEPNPPQEKPSNKPMPTKTVRAFGNAVMATVRAPSRLAMGFAILTTLLAVTIVAVALYGEMIEAWLLPQAPSSYIRAMHTQMLWTLGALTVAPLLGYLIERGKAAIHILPTFLPVQPIALKPGPCWFPIDRIADDRPRRWFDRAELLQIARAVPSRLGILDAPHLDLVRTVHATARSGSLPTLVFGKRKETVPVRLLVDRDSGARGWSDLPMVLRDDLERIGVEASLGYFDGRPERFDLADGTRAELSALLRRGELLLVISDGARLGGREDARALLRRLGAAGCGAWIEERECRFWHPLEPQFGIPGLPAWPGTAAGIAAALSSFGGERTPPPLPPARPVIPSATAAVPGAHAATVLGDAIGWAAACAMVQPIGPALAQALRAEFFPFLSPLAFGRMVALNGSQLTQAGLSFATPMLALLKSDFALRFDTQRRGVILQAIRNAIESRNPHYKDSPAQHAYDWYRARFLLEQDPDTALLELLRLKSTALGPAIARDLRQRRLPHGDAPPEPGTVPLLRRPSDLRALIQVTTDYDVELTGAGEKVEPWHMLPRTDEVRFPEGGLAAATAAGKLVVLLDNWRLSLGSSTVLDLAPPDHWATGPAGKDLRLSLSADAGYAAIANGTDGGVAVFDLARPSSAVTSAQQPRQPVSLWYEGKIVGLAWSPTEPLLVCAAHTALLLFDLRTGKDVIPQFPLELRGGFQRASCAAFTRDGKEVLIGVGNLILQWPTGALIEAARQSEYGEDERVFRSPSDSSDTTLPAIEALATAGSDSVIAAVGDGQVIVLREDDVNYGPWDIPSGRVDGLELVEGGKTVAVLAGGQLGILHARTGLDLLDGDRQDGRHAALAVGAGQALLWAADRRGVTRHGFERGIPDEARQAA
jgi:hypothetical protein